MFYRCIFHTEEEFSEALQERLCYQNIMGKDGTNTQILYKNVLDNDQVKTWNFREYFSYDPFDINSNTVYIQYLR